MNIIRAKVNKWNKLQKVEMEWKWINTNKSENENEKMKMRCMIMPIHTFVNAFYKTTKSCLIEGLITLSYNVYTFWMDTVFFLSFFLSFFFFLFVFVFVFCFCFLLFVFVFFHFYCSVTWGWWVEGSYKDNHQPPSSFSAIHVRYTCIMTVNNILFWNPPLLRAVIGL